MTFKVLLIALLFARIVYPELPVFPGDSGVVLAYKPDVMVLNWNFPNGSDTHSIVQCGEGAIHGQSGMRFLVQKERSYAFRNIKANFYPTVWMRFYLRIDSVETPDEDSASLGLMSFAVSEKVETGTSEPCVFIQGLKLRREPEQTRLCLFSGKNRMEAALKSAKNYCVEVQLLFKEKDTLAVQYYIDGKRIGTFSRQYLPAKHFFQVNLSTDTHPPGYWKLMLDDFVLSDKRIKGLPVTARACSTHVEGWKAVLSSSEFSSDYFGETLKSVEYQVFSADTELFPIYQGIENQPDSFFKKTVPFFLDSGRYYWRCRFVNSDSVAGDWSPLTEFVISSGRACKVSLHQIWLSLPGKKEPLTQLQKERWYDIHVKLATLTSWDSLGYLLIWLNNKDCFLGHPKNKGGPFLPQSNYCFNLSLARGDGWLFEKRTLGSSLNNRVLRDSIGLYTDNQVGAIKVDRHTGLIRIRFRLPAQASAGEWQCSGCVIYPDGKNRFATVIESHSNIMRIKFSLSEIQVSTGKLRPILIGLGILLIVGFSVFSIKRRKKNPEKILPSPEPQPDGEFSRITAYVEAHLTEKIMSKDIQFACAISYFKLNEILKRNKTSLPQLINTLRVTKVKELLVKEPNKTITEIGLSVGYTEPHHFYAAFKQVEGVTPKEFRQKQQGQ